ncbi:MAG: hypothetical protein ABR498_04085 [Candidatus Dormibacteria bacterium]
MVYTHYPGTVTDLALLEGVQRIFTYHGVPHARFIPAHGCEEPKCVLPAGMSDTDERAVADAVTALIGRPVRAVDASPSE